MNVRAERNDMRFVAALILLHAFYFLLATRYTRIFMGDSFEYIYEAVNIRDYFFFYSGNPALAISPEYMTQRQPIYPLFLLSVYLFSVNNWIVLVIQNVISIFNIWYSRNIFLRLGGAKKYDWIWLLLLVGLPSQFINANTIAPDILLQTCTLLYVGNYIRLWQERKLLFALRMSLWLAVGLLVKPVLYPFAVMHLFILAITFGVWRAKLQRPIAVAVLPLIVVLLYCYSNYTRTGKFHFSSNQAFNAVYYFYPYVSQAEGVDSANRFLTGERAKIASFPEFSDRYDCANAAGATLLREHWSGYLLFHFRNSLRIFIEPGKAELDLFAGRLTYGRLYSKKQEGFFAAIKQKDGLLKFVRANPSLPIVLFVFLFNCVRNLGFILFLRRRDIAPGIRIFVFVLTCYFAVAAGPIANTRYFLPVVLLTMGGAVIGFSGLAEKRKPGELKPLDLKA